MFYHCLKILNTFWARGPAVILHTGPSKLCSWSCLGDSKKNMWDGRYCCGHLWETICHRQLMSVWGLTVCRTLYFIKFSQACKPDMKYYSHFADGVNDLFVLTLWENEKPGFEPHSVWLLYPSADPLCYPAHVDYKLSHSSWPFELLHSYYSSRVVR